MIGSISHGTMRREDLIPTFVAELKRHQTAEQYAELIAHAESIVDFDDEAAGDVLCDLFDALDEVAPEGTYFGAHPGDGSDYGFWPCEEE